MDVFDRVLHNDDPELLPDVRTLSEWHFVRAVTLDKVRCVERILSVHPEYVNTATWNDSAVIYAIPYFTHMMEVLVRHGANINTQRTSDGRTILDKINYYLEDDRRGADQPWYLTLVTNARLLVNAGARVLPNHHPVILAAHESRKLALSLRRTAAGATINACEAHGVPRDLLRMIGKEVVALDWKEWK